KEVNPGRVLEAFKTKDVVVVAGFQGQKETGDVTTIGRGGSDTTAEAIGVALKAECVEYFNDVNGVMTAEPRVVSSSRVLYVITYTEICYLAYQGAKVIHPRAVEIAMHAHIPMRVRSTYSEEEGTLVTDSRIQEFGQDIPDRLIT